MAPSKLPTGDVAIAGNLLVADGARLQGNLRCNGHARIGKAATVEGDVEVAGSLSVRAGADIRGAVRCDGDIEWHPSAAALALRCAGELRVDGHRLALSVDAAEGVFEVEEESA